MNARSALLLNTGMLTAIGLSAAQTASSARAGIARFAESSFFAKNGEPMTLALVPEEALAPVEELLDVEATWNNRAQRLLALAVPALQEALAGVEQPQTIPLFLGLPDELAAQGAEFLASLAQVAEFEFDRTRSETICAGRAAGLLALDRALEFLANGRGPFAVVGGVDSYFDLDVLNALDAEDRVAGEGVMDGFIPGEGACFLLLGAPDAPRSTTDAELILISAPGLGIESGHRYSQEPHRGDGLAAAFAQLFSSAAAAHTPVHTVFAGYNGENSWAKEWGVAYLRNKEKFAEPFAFEHPVDCFGDPGAALGPLLIGLAARGMTKGYRSGPCLVWCGSDRDARGAVLVTTGER